MELTLNEKLIYTLEKLEETCENDDRKENIRIIKEELLKKDNSNEK